MCPIRIYSEKIDFEVKGEFHVVDLTSKVESAVECSGIKEGVVFVSTGHTTGTIVLNEYEREVLEDLKKFLRRFILSDGEYTHNENGFAHLRSIFLLSSKVIPIHAGRLGLGRWQILYWVEMDRHNRKRIVEATVIGE
ncbi:secondary thiamine-phosphate synthase enzyme YjbQ [Candidatus Bathyarchaeota archaeon]|nr:secondary thiamine-phosphate synthase enzyme YjbQ [Candidatus Bathyarchaeota archaeon]MBS7631440.1 secondary thiamine-phosphate synthase enzyme YjbQ [Candidatus Bathyarchaeota archaeon]